MNGERRIFVGELTGDDESIVDWGTDQLFDEVVAEMASRVARGDRFHPDSEVIEVVIVRRHRIIGSPAAPDES